MRVLVALCISVFVLELVSCDNDYLIGVGIGDVTGPAAEINMMGYAHMEQNTEGIHLRQFSRAFIFVDPKTNKRVVFISVDAGMISVNIKRAVIKELKTKYGENMYDWDNVMITGTHTHSGVGGFHQYVLYLVTSLGFVRETYDNFVTGIVKSVERAHSGIRPGKVLMASGDLDGSNINRSPASYLNNPADERQRYAHNTDHEMVLLKLEDASGHGIGMLNWFAVHPVSMNNTNKMISSDNKGVAQTLFEKEMNPGSFMGQGTFVAAFANSNLGDVSPNMDGPKCSDTGKECDVLTSSCPNKDAQCYAQGPGKNMIESTKIIGTNQYNKAKELYNEAKTVQHGDIDYRHEYVDMTIQEVAINSTYKVKTCKPAMGYSFAAGTTDGPGAFDFKQGDKTGNIFWDTIRNLIRKPSDEMLECHKPKPVLLPTGEIKYPYAWQPSIVETQIMRIGQFVIVGVPGEFTTMSGRRLRDTVKQVLLDNGYPADTKVVLAGLANDYSSYIATFEEYQVQRYEGASTIYGPHTLQAYQQKFASLAQAMAKGRRVEPGTPPPDLMDKQWSFVPPVFFDAAPEGKKFGDVVKNPKPTYRVGDTVEAVFVTGHPRNDPMLESSYLMVEKQVKDQWVVVARDADWETKYKWERTSELLGHSNAHITWTIPANQEAGVYRIRHFGHRKFPITGEIEPFKGTSSVFKIVSNRTKMPTKWANLSANRLNHNI